MGNDSVAEAIFFFDGHALARQMTYAEFQAILDSYIPLEDVANKTVEAVYVRVNDRLLMTAAVFFYLPFDQQGFVAKSWDIPLEQLADTTAEGPDRGAGPIRLACSSQCPIAWHQKNLWAPDTGAASIQFSSIEKALKNNTLGLSFTAVSEVSGAAPAKRQADPEARLRAARLLKQYRLKYQLFTAKARQDRRQLVLDHQQCMLSYQQRILQQDQQIKALQGTIARQQSAPAERCDTAAAKLDDSGQAGAAAVENVAHTGVDVLTQLHNSGVNLVSYHPGAGHLSIPIDEVKDYLDSPLCYVARQCGVNEHLYRVWLDHFYSPSCQHCLADDEHCDAPLERVEDPRQFVVGQSDRCQQHQGQQASVISISKNGRQGEVCSINKSLR
ncbi:MAG: hypothetical protein KTR20_06335 [Cellvibrionaceae bacterium]|nr:hypothetical protein [Cellvibrionaceae bacterium]